MGNKCTNAVCSGGIDASGGLRMRLQKEVRAATNLERYLPGGKRSERQAAIR